MPSQGQCSIRRNRKGFRSPYILPAYEYRYQITHSPRGEERLHRVPGRTHEGRPKWQRTVPKIAESLGIDNVTFLNPYPCQRWVVWKRQVDWETEGLRSCDVALFWIPNQETEVEGQDYAQATRMELLENLALGRKVILGIDSDIRAADYMRHKAKAYGLTSVHRALEGCLKELKSLIPSEV